MFVTARERVDRWNGGLAGFVGERRDIVLTVVGARSSLEKDGTVYQSSRLAATVHPRQCSDEEEGLVPAGRRG